MRKKELLFSNEQEILKENYTERLWKIKELSKKINYDNIKYYVRNSNTEFSFSKLRDPENLIEDIRKGKIDLEKAKNDQVIFEKYLNRIIVRGTSGDQKTTVANINILFKGRNNAIKFFDGYRSMILESRKRAFKGKRLKILPHKQMLEISPIALIKVKSRNTS